MRKSAFYLAEGAFPVVCLQSPLTEEPLAWDLRAGSISATSYGPVTDLDHPVVFAGVEQRTLKRGPDYSRFREAFKS
jgi:hypothetical protein